MFSLIFLYPSLLFHDFVNSLFSLSLLLIAFLTHILRHYVSVCVFILSLRIIISTSLFVSWGKWPGTTSVRIDGRTRTLRLLSQRIATELRPLDLSRSSCRSIHTALKINMPIHRETGLYIILVGLHLIYSF